MINDSKPPMFGPSGVFDLASYVPRSGKTFWVHYITFGSTRGERMSDMAARPPQQQQSASSKSEATVLMRLVSSERPQPHGGQLWGPQSSYDWCAFKSSKVDAGPCLPCPPAHSSANANCC